MGVWRTRSESDGTLSLTVIAINSDQDYSKIKVRIKMADLLTAEGRSNEMRPKIGLSRVIGRGTEDEDKKGCGRRMSGRR